MYFNNSIGYISSEIMKSKIENDGSIIYLFILIRYHSDSKI